MSEITFDKAGYWPSPLTEWYRERPFKVALAGSLLIHAALLAAIPGFRAVTIEAPQILNVEIVEEQAPAPVQVPPRRVLRSRPEAVPAPVIKPAPPPAMEREVVRPEPRRVEPEPMRVPEPVVRQSPPEVPTPQAEIIQTLPRPDQRPEPAAVPRPEPRSSPPAQPREEPRIDIPPQSPMPRAAPPQPPQIEQPRVETVPVPAGEPTQLAIPDAPQVTVQAPPAPVQKTAPDAERTLVTSYEKSLSDLIKRHEKYPDRARRQGWQGTAVVGLSVSTDGKVTDISILESSGREILDEAAVQMVRRASPLPRAPEGLRGRERIVRIPIAFKLNT